MVSDSLQNRFKEGWDLRIQCKKIDCRSKITIDRAGESVAEIKRQNHQLNNSESSYLEVCYGSSHTSLLWPHNTNTLIDRLTETHRMHSGFNPSPPKDIHLVQMVVSNPLVLSFTWETLECTYTKTTCFTTEVSQQLFNLITHILTIPSNRLVSTQPWQVQPTEF